MDIDTTHEGSKEDEGVNNVDLEEIPLLVDLSVFDDLDDIEVEKRLENTRDFHDQVEAVHIKREKVEEEEVAVGPENNGKSVHSDLPAVSCADEQQQHQQQREQPPAKIPRNDQLETVIKSDLNNGLEKLSQKYPMVSFRKLDKKPPVPDEPPGPVNGQIQSESISKASPEVASQQHCHPLKRPCIQVYKSSKELLNSPEHRAMPKLESLVLSNYSCNNNNQSSESRTKITESSSSTSTSPSKTPRPTPQPSPPHLSPQLSLRNVNSQSKRKTSNSSSSSPEEKSLDLFSYYSRLPKTITVETYYCGELEGKPFTNDPAFPSGNFQCSSCDKIFDSNVEVYAHMYSHGVPTKLGSDHVRCVYCMEPVLVDQLGDHVKNVHHMIEAGCCRICEKNFTEQFQLVIHMWANHCRYDMPYACGICDYRSSLKFQVIDHFNLAHQGAASILCPICLQVLNCKSSANLAEILAHAQLHQFNEGHRCGHCALVFPLPKELKAHFQEGFHTSKRRARNSRAVIPYQNQFGVKLSLMPKPPPQFCDDYESNNNINNHGIKNFSPAKKSTAQKHKLQLQQQQLQQQQQPKVTKELRPKKLVLEKTEAPPPAADNSIVEKFSVNYNITGKEVCLECGTLIGQEGHFPGKHACGKCIYRTCCKNAVGQHKLDSICKPGRMHHVPLSAQDPESWLIREKFRCECGFACINPNRFAFHLAGKCRKSGGILVAATS